MHVDEETVENRERAAWAVLAFIGVGLALYGSYMAVQAAFDDDTLCSAALGCITIDDTQDIWFGLVLTVAGVLAALKARRELRA